MVVAGAVDDRVTAIVAQVPVCGSEPPTVEPSRANFDAIGSPCWAVRWPVVPTSRWGPRRWSRRTNSVRRPCTSAGSSNSGDQRDVGGPRQRYQVIVVGIPTDRRHFGRVIEQFSARVQLRHEFTGLVEGHVASEPFAGQDPTELAQQVRRGHQREPVDMEGESSPAPKRRASLGATAERGRGRPACPSPG